jgi:hypothetical protein
MHRFDLIAPFAAAILIYFIAPLLSSQVKSVIRSAISEGRLHVGLVAENEIPYYLAPPSIEDYVEYAMDAVQVFPACLLPIIGSIYAFGSGIPTGVSASILVLALVATIAMSAWIMSRPAPDYVSRKWHGYSIISLLGVIINIIGIILTLLFAP